MKRLISLLLCIASITSTAFANDIKNQATAMYSNAVDFYTDAQGVYVTLPWSNYKYFNPSEEDVVDDWSQLYWDNSGFYQTSSNYYQNSITAGDMFEMMMMQVEADAAYTDALNYADGCFGFALDMGNSADEMSDLFTTIADVRASNTLIVRNSANSFYDSANSSYLATTSRVSLYVPVYNDLMSRWNLCSGYATVNELYNFQLHVTSFNNARQVAIDDLLEADEQMDDGIYLLNLGDTTDATNDAEGAYALYESARAKFISAEFSIMYADSSCNFCDQKLNEMEVIILMCESRM